MFSEYVNNLQNYRSPSDTGPEEIEGALEQLRANGMLSPEHIKCLLSPHVLRNGHFYRQIRSASEVAKLSLFNGMVFGIAPLYVTSICQEHCMYCNYIAGKKDKNIQRVRLSNKEVAKEVEFLVKKGLRVIELVYATDPFLTIDNISDHIKITHDVLSNFGEGTVGINARSYSEEEYGKLKEAGLSFVVSWQETYDEKRYKQLHPGKTEKANFYYRLNAPERMVSAGIENIGLGVLSGLADWRKDWYALAKHAHYLLEEYGNRINAVILGIPRLKPAAGALVRKTAFVPDDKEFLLAISSFNLLLPAALPFVNTRESWAMCTQMARGGGSLFTFNCRTIPGGYSLGHSGYQFPTCDFDVDEYIGRLHLYGLRPVLDWSFDALNWKRHLQKSIGTTKSASNL